LLDDAQKENRLVQSLKATIRSHQVSLDVFVEQEHTLTVEQGDARQKLKGALEEFVTASPNSVRTLLSVAYEDEGALIEEALPAAAMALPIIAKAEQPELVGAAARLRPSHRP
jgi:ribosomal protein L16/L10AE